jgi:ribosome-binding protein aMBF1 (putative translation factor)
MDKDTRERLQAAGFRIGGAEDFLELTAEERRLVELRLAVSRTVRRLREQGGVSQKQLAVKMKSSQSRVAKIEAGASDVSLDLLFKALFATGGGVEDLAPSVRRRRPSRRTNGDARR